MTSDEEIEAEAQHKVTALDRLQMVSKLFQESNFYNRSNKIFNA